MVSETSSRSDWQSLGANGESPIKIERFSMKDEVGGSGKRPTRGAGGSAVKGGGMSGGGMSGGGMGGARGGMGSGRSPARHGGRKWLADYWPAAVVLSVLGVVAVAVGLCFADPFGWCGGGEADLSDSGGSDQSWWPPMAAITYGEFHQPEMIRALHSGDTQLSSVVVKIPRNAPNFLKSQDLHSRGQRTTKKIYALQLVIELENLALDERPEHLAVGTPLLKKLVHADVAGEARVRLESDSEPLVSQLSRDVVDWAKVFTTAVAAITADINNGQPGFATDANREARRVSDYMQTLTNHAKIDAGILKEIYYQGQIEAIEAVYASLGEYVLGEPVWSLY
jgi:hypothetical protein